MKKYLTRTLMILLSILASVCCFTACSGAPQTVAVESVTLDKTQLSLEIGEDATLTATVLPDNATNRKVSWSVAPEGIVSVENGTITAIAAGEAVVTASADGKSASCNVTVTARDSALVDEETWKTAFSASPNVYTMTSYQEGYDAPIVYKLNLTENIIYIVEFTASAGGSPDTGSSESNPPEVEKVFSTEVIFQKVGDSYFRYDLTDDQTWERQESSESEYNDYMERYATFLPELMLRLKDRYASFTYAEGKYSATDVAVMDIQFNKVSVVFENGTLKTIDLAKAGQTMRVDLGVAEITLPDDGVGEEDRIIGDYYLVEFGETEWQVNLSSKITFYSDGNCDAMAPAQYSKEGDLITISYDHGVTKYAVLEGKIMWIFSSAADTSDVSLAQNALYAETTIAADDLLRIDAVLGEPQS